MDPIRPDQVEYLTGRHSGRLRPSGIALLGEGGKFTPDGAVQRWPGNTFVCHVDPRSRAHMLMRELQEEIRKSAFGRFFTFLPAPSFHMTVLQGCSPDTRPGHELPKDPYDGLGRDDVTRAMLARLEGCSLPKGFRIKVRNLFAGHSLTVSGANPAEENAIRQARRELSDRTGLRFADFETYILHITLSYLLEWLSDSTARELAEFSIEAGDRLAAKIGDIDLGPVEFCNFETMHHFEPVRILA